MKVAVRDLVLSSSSPYMRRCSTLLKPKTVLKKNAGKVRKARLFLLGRCSTLLKLKKKLKKPHKKPDTEEDEPSSIEEGDIVNISDMLFTDYRDHLIKNNKELVTAQQLQHKVLVLYFVKMCEHLDADIENRARLIDIYSEISCENGFEVVFIFCEDTMENRRLNPLLPQDPEECFSIMLSHVPWTAIPYWDVQSRERLERRFGLSKLPYTSESFIIDPAGTILECGADSFLYAFGPEAYPFTYERFEILYSEEKKTAKQPTLKKLLASPKPGRDIVISNKREEVPIADLEGKVVALYLYEHGNTASDLTEKLKMAYQELKEHGEEFEVVLVDLHYTDYTCVESNEDSFWERFKTMPWLALPFKDWRCRKLARILKYPLDSELLDNVYPSLVFIGSDGKSVVLYGADILREYGSEAYPFTPEKAAKLEAERVKKLKLFDLWDPDVVFEGINGSRHVRFSKLARKRVLFLIETRSCIRYTKFLNMLKQRYSEEKGKVDEFEVVHICETRDKASFDKLMLDLPWLVHPFSKAFEYGKEILYLVLKFFTWGISALIAFERDGRLLTVAAYTKFINTKYIVEGLDFPFVSQDLEKHAMTTLFIRFFGDYYNDVESDDDDTSDI